MSSDLYDLGAVGSGRVVICAAPASAELPNWVSQLKQIGATLVVCLLEEAESERIGLEAEEDALTASGLTFLRFPIADFGVPEKTPAKELIAELSKRLAHQETVAIHCRGGVGRSGMIAACLMINERWSFDQALEHISSARGQAVPETEDQRHFIRDFDT